MNILRMSLEEFKDLQARLRAGNTQERASKGRTPAKAQKRAVARPKHKYGYEERLATQLNLARITGFRREYRWCPGRKFKADLAFPKRRLLIEIDGMVHRIKGRWKADLEKRQLAIINTWVLLPLSTNQVRRNEAVTIIERVLEILK